MGQARALALQGVGYGPRLLALQGVGLRPSHQPRPFPGPAARFIPEPLYVRKTWHIGSGAGTLPLLQGGGEGYLVRHGAGRGALPSLSGQGTGSTDDALPMEVLALLLD
jgi:hypothetical protein